MIAHCGGPSKRRRIKSLRTNMENIIFYLKLENMHIFIKNWYTSTYAIKHCSRWSMVQPAHLIFAIVIPELN